MTIRRIHELVARLDSVLEELVHRRRVEIERCGPYRRGAYSVTDSQANGVGALFAGLGRPGGQETNQESAYVKLHRAAE